MFRRLIPTRTSPLVHLKAFGVKKVNSSAIKNNDVLAHNAAVAAVNGTAESMKYQRNSVYNNKYAVYAAVLGESPGVFSLYF